MNEKQNTDKSFEQKSGQNRRENSSASSSVPAASYREIRAKSVSMNRRRTQSEKAKEQKADNDRRQELSEDKKSSAESGNAVEAPKQNKPTEKNGMKRQPQRVKPKPSEGGQPIKKKSTAEESADKPAPKAERSDKAQPDKAKQETKQEAKQPPEKTKPPEKKRRKRSTKPFSAKKRKRKIAALYTSMVIIIAMIAAVLCLTVFFEIDSITVEGETRYSTDEIIEASGITLGTNLLLCNTDSCDDLIMEKFPYIETVTVKKNAFNSVTIYVEETEPATAIETNGKFYILSAKGKIIEILDNNKYDVPLIKGAELKKTELSATIEYKLENMNSIISDVTQAIEDNKLENVSTINVTSPSNVKLSYDKRLTIILGMPENLSYKVKTAKVIIDEKLEKDSKGTVDVSMCAEGGKYSYYDPSGAPES